MKFSITDKAWDARATWTVTFGDRYLGQVSEYSDGYRITDAGPYCQVSQAPHPTRIGAACVLMTARRTNRAEQVDDSGLMRIERDVLDFEAARSHTEDERECEAVRLGINLVSYRQIARRMRLDARAAAYSPKAVASLREQHEAASARTARLRRPAAPLAAAS